MIALASGGATSLCLLKMVGWLLSCLAQDRLKKFADSAKISNFQDAHYNLSCFKTTNVEHFSKISLNLISVDSILVTAAFFWRKNSIWIRIQTLKN